MINHQNRIAIKSSDTNYDVNIYSLGCEQTFPGKSVGPCVRSKYVIHYVFDGKGVFNGKPIQRGSGFLICPNQLHYYESDESFPLKYGWISFYGYGTEKILKEAGFELINQVFTFDWTDTLDLFFQNLCVERSDVDMDEYLIGCFHILMSFHIQSYRTRQNDKFHESAVKEHVGTAVRFINDNYCHAITVRDIANDCCISAHYLSNIFKAELGFPPQKYLLTVRMNRAAELLALENLSIAEIALSVGYADALAFSKIFRKFYGSSPRSYRKSIGK